MPHLSPPGSSAAFTEKMGKMSVSVIFAKTDEKKDGWLQFQDGKRQGFQTQGFTLKSNETGIDDIAQTLTVSQ